MAGVTKMLIGKVCCIVGRHKNDKVVGEFGYNNNGERMTIIRYGTEKDIDIQFDDGTIVQHKQYSAFKKGEIKNPFFPTIYGVGFIGVGDYKTCDENGKPTKCYATWSSMHQRCYDPKYQQKHPTYKNCKVCEEWNDYQAFAKWDNENYYEVGNERMDLDKDILCKGNKIYSPDTCIYVPHSINGLFAKCNKTRGNCPIGVGKHGNKFRARLNKGNGKHIYLGAYDTPEQAFLAYKKAKEEYIKEVAEEYKGKIDNRAYEALINYEVEIDD